MTEADPPSAALAEKRELALAAVNDILPQLGPVSARNLGLLHGELLKALGALGGTLVLHGAVPWYSAASDCEHPEPSDDMSDEWQDWDDTHQAGSGGNLICLLSVLGHVCPECTRVKYGDEAAEDGEFVPAPCSTRTAILGALTGEAKLWQGSPPKRGRHSARQASPKPSGTG